jgi:hypothetical protein
MYSQKMGQSQNYFLINGGGGSIDINDNYV